MLVFRVDSSCGAARLPPMSVIWSIALALGAAMLGAALVASWRRGAGAGPDAADDFERLFERAPVAIALTDGAGRIQRINQHFAQLFGYSQADAAGAPINDLIVPPDRPAEAREVSRFAAGESKAIPATVRRRKDGTLVDVSVHCTAIALQGAERGAVYSIYQDITDRVRAQEDVVVAEEQFRQLAENIDEVFWLTTPERSRLLYVSPAYERIFGQSR